MPSPGATGPSVKTMVITLRLCRAHRDLNLASKVVFASTSRHPPCNRPLLAQVEDALQGQLHPVVAQPRHLRQGVLQHRHRGPRREKYFKVKPENIFTSI